MVYLSSSKVILLRFHVLTIFQREIDFQKGMVRILSNNYDAGFFAKIVIFAKEVHDRCLVGF